MPIFFLQATGQATLPALNLSFFHGDLKPLKHLSSDHQARPATSPRSTATT